MGGRSFILSAILYLLFVWGVCYIVDVAVVLTGEVVIFCGELAVLTG